MDNMTIPASSPNEQPANKRLDLKSLRFAVHGWWLGNPLVYKPGARIDDVAHELARAGATSGTLILSGTSGDTSDARDASSMSGKGNTRAMRRQMLRAVLILRLPLSRTVLAEAATLVAGEVAQATLGRSYAINDQWEVVMRDSHTPASVPICHVAVEAHEGALLLELRIDLEQLWTLGYEGDRPASALLARPDWREVFLARILHALDIRLRLLLSTNPTIRQSPSA